MKRGLLVLWLLVLSWCAMHTSLTHRADVQNAPDPDDIDFFWEPQEPYDV